ncbi:putative C2 domain, GRAM domain, PH-like domain superfamily, VASt domain, C2 domain superfamily [Helianthus annuus]|uniref:C2 domain, GRAM domain, PH-like domain superfamily, VASt domain, C2 domain superfamily n=1 Tax=Helianthus annuus TaxID=4232 RepID=A0A251URI6_HELAN|nr:C2 and GRAM domain-containing protein At5g50170 [Helianthus annuus]KAF5807077.1 putative C2 domain, GRAM domain, PH-like domain superfamily, VASt domain, C2 domain superfamily [Helianthus annuus]KAJ0923846.1 putative C2 domain, GRAM domain, PH-like domain superfamily, VASt domain, C2 domain superfamily [Helianthus annuus]
MIMKLYVYVLEGKDWAVEESYVKLKVGKFKSRTRVLKNTRNPVWNEEFVFRVDCLDDDELVVSVYDGDGDDESSGLFKVNSCRSLVGRVRIPLWSVAAEEDHHLQPTWFSVQSDESNESIEKACGKILLALSLHGKNQDISNGNQFLQPSMISDQYSDIKQSPSHDSNTSKSPRKMIKSITRRFEKLFHKHNDSSGVDDSSDLPTTSSDNGESTEELPLITTFEDSMETMESLADQKEMPENLQGGVLLDETYVVPPKDLNHFLFAPDSQFMKELAAIQSTTDVHESPWTWESGQTSSLTRTVTYTKGATKLVKASKVTEDQTYIKANGKDFAVFIRVDTPDVPYGSTFQVKLLYKIMHGPEIGGDETSRILVSWGIDFHQSTMMKSMIEHGAKQGLKESFEQFSELLGQTFKPVNQLATLDKSQTLATLQNEHESDWDLAVGYFCNFTVVSTVLMVLYAFVHVLLCGPNQIQGLEFNGLELPDSFGEFVTCGIILFNLQHVYIMASHFVQARLRRGNDHGVKAQGEGWVLTVAIIEGTNLAPLDSSGFSDPYVVLTCNGKTRTSSVKLQTLDPQWNEVLEFDAAEEPPSLLDVEVFDFDGPFGQAASLGHAEIRFLRHTTEELADMWVPLEGRLAKSLQSKLHLRIFLDNNNGVETIKEYMTKVEKEAGKKINVRSPHRNSTFQKLFSLPPEEFLVSDFSCSLKRKLPLQGRLYVSSRIVGFYANLFGHKTKFSFLWEDVEDIHSLPPTLASVGSPILVMVLLKGRGVDARHGAKSQDEKGRLCFYFHSFVSFSSARRTIMALWRTRSSSPDPKTDVFEDTTVTSQDHQHQEKDEKCLCEDVTSHLVVGDAKMTKIYSEELPISLESIMEIFKGGDLEHKVMGKLWCLNYNTTPWEPVTGHSDMLERRLCWKFNRRVSSFGGDVTCTQQKLPIVDGKGWTITEAMALHDVPFGDHFYVQVKYEMVDRKPGWCACDVFIGVVWLKSCKFEQRITRNVVVKFGDRVRELFELVEREVLLAVDGRS